MIAKQKKMGFEQYAQEEKERKRGRQEREALKEPQSKQLLHTVVSMLS